MIVNSPSPITEEHPGGDLPAFPIDERGGERRVKELESKRRYIGRKGECEILGPYILRDLRLVVLGCLCSVVWSPATPAAGPNSYAKVSTSSSAGSVEPVLGAQ